MKKGHIVSLLRRSGDFSEQELGGGGGDGLQGTGYRGDEESGKCSGVGRFKALRFGIFRKRPLVFRLTLNADYQPLSSTALALIPCG